VSRNAEKKVKTIESEVVNEEKKVDNWRNHASATCLHGAKRNRAKRNGADETQVCTVRLDRLFA